MATFCTLCGNEIVEGSGFCGSCGAKVEDFRPTGGKVHIGFSDKIDDPELLAARRKQKRATFIFALIIIPLPIMITLILGIANDSFEYLPVGGGVTLIFLLSVLISVIKSKTKTQWDGTVLKKYTREVRTRDKDGDYLAHTEYIIEVQKDDGKMTKIKEGGRSGGASYYFDYLNEGDKIRYYPQFANFYEKYDKTGDSEVNCPICSTFNSLDLDYCEKCGAPIFK